MKNKERIIIKQDAGIQDGRVFKERRDTIEKVNAILVLLRKLDNATGLKLAPTKGNFDDIDKAIKAAIYNSDRESQYILHTDDTMIPQEDFRANLSNWEKQMYEAEFGPVDAPKPGSPAFKEGDRFTPIDVVEELISEVKKYDNIRKPYASVWGKYISLEKGKLAILEGADDKITSDLTTYANDKQEAVYTRLMSAMEIFNQVEKEFPGIRSVVEMIAKKDTKYFVQPEALINL